MYGASYLSTMETPRMWIEPVVAVAQIASSFYDTALLMVVRNHYNKTINKQDIPTNSSVDDVLQKAISNFYIFYNVIMGLTPTLSAYILAKIADKTSRKVTLCVPLLGYLLSRMFLLFIIIWEWPIEVMFGSAALNGLTGWFTSYWAGVMAWASLCSSERRRSMRLIIIEMVYGLAGFVGSLLSGHIFVNLNFANQEGTILICCSCGCYAFCFLYSLFVLRTPGEDHCSESRSLLKDTNNTTVQADSRNESTPVSPCRLILITMFTSAVLFNIAFTASDDVINVFVLKAPLSWGPVEVGYGNAAAYMTYLTSFLGVFIFNRCMGDLGLIAIGIVSFSSGLLIMAFVRWTYMYYIARVVMMFSQIATPTIRSVISKQIQGSSYGKVFVVLQLAIEIVAVSSSAGFNKLYQATLDWYSGFCFLVFSSLGFLSIIPIGLAACHKCSSVCQRNTRDTANQSQTAEASSS
ncbi:solute carrier family 46 member 2-like [Hyperolius riggenbachi]|uniref:solute carrier family 46 member 2-like n=1 Tax=Hyperolius riggenbachi TaxID=752182 RepID=UPI0035A2F52F